MPQITRAWYLEVNGVALATPAWEIPDFATAFDSAPLLGGDRPIPDGLVIPLPRDPTVKVETYPLEVFGAYDSDGVAYTDPLEGLEQNLEYLDENLGYGKQTGDGTVVVRRHRGTLAPLICDAHFLGFKGSVKIGDADIRATFDLSIPNGWMTEAASS